MMVRRLAAVAVAVCALAACGPEGSGNSASSSPTPTNTPSPAEGVLTVTLTWDSGPSDFDLHLALESSGGMFGVSPFDCSYANQSPDWGAPGGSNDPALEADATDGPGPEVIRISEPMASASYRIYAHHFSDGGAGAVSGSVRIEDGTNEVATFTITSLPPDYVTDVGSVSAPDGSPVTFTVSGVEFPAPGY